MVSLRPSDHTKHIPPKGIQSRKFRKNQLLGAHFTPLESKILSRFRWISRSLAKELNIDSGPPPALREMAKERAVLWGKFRREVRKQEWDDSQSRRNWRKVVRQFYEKNGWIVSRRPTWAVAGSVPYKRKQISPLHWYDKMRRLFPGPRLT